MLTAFHIEEHEGGLLRYFRRNRLRVEHSFCDDAAVKSITYEHYRGKIGWSAIDRFVKAQRNRLLCSDALELPAELGYKRFVSYELSRRMCENAALFLLRELQGLKLSVTLYDPDGACAPLCEYLIPYTDPVCVVTDATDLYIEQARVLLREKGAALRISKGMTCLQTADLIVAPHRITRPLPCRPTATVLSGERPAAAQPAPVIYDYFIELPQKFVELKPPYLEDMYFASALYTLAGVDELGSELFYRCGDGSVIHTRRSLVEFLKKSVIA